MKKGRSESTAAFLFRGIFQLIQRELWIRTACDNPQSQYKSRRLQTSSTLVSWPGSPLEGALVEEVLQPPAYQAAMNH
ncbi:MAG: hypothetical protein R2825_01515 [Saprospiraceae bacterium]